MTTNKRRTTTTCLPWILFAVLLAGCGRKAVQLDQGWSSPVKVTDSKDSLVGGVQLYKWGRTIIALKGLDDGTARCFAMNNEGDNGSWTEVQLTGVPRGYLWAYPAIDEDKVVFEEGYMEGDQLVMNAFVGRMAGKINVERITERRWVTDKKSLFGETASNVRLNEPGRRNWPQLGLGNINGRDMYIPYCLEGRLITYRGKSMIVEQGPANNGVFHSADSGMAWDMERISQSYACLPSMSRTKGYYYSFAVSLPTGPGHVWELWYARKSATGNSWEAPKAVTKTFGRSALIWKYVSAAEDDTVHLCWLDSRHEKKRRNPVYPFRENYEVVYCQRKDSDTNWSKDVILSEGMLYSYSPTMSVEGEKVVVAWAGVPTAPDEHHEYAPNDIYYVTSTDGGKTWSRRLKLTDGAKAGITSGRPEVVLQNGVIHLFYIQGNLNLKQESPGLTKLNQPPWPICYQRRNFPN